VSVFVSSRNRVAQLHPEALGSLFVAFYNSQGDGGVILTRLRMRLPSVYDAHNLRINYEWEHARQPNDYTAITDAVF
jgi:hypothetical protein